MVLLNLFLLAYRECLGILEGLHPPLDLASPLILEDLFWKISFIHSSRLPPILGILTCILSITRDQTNNTQKCKQKSVIEFKDETILDSK